MTAAATPRTIVEQLPAIQVALWLATVLEDLPAPSITISAYDGPPMRLGLDSAADFEMWRKTLQLPDSAVTFHHYSANSWLSVDAVISGVVVEIAAHVEVLPESAVLSPQDDAEQRARAEQAVPQPPAAAPIEVGALADVPGGAL